MTLLRVRQLSFGHGRALTPPIDLAFEREQIWALLGRNGAGKTTLTRTLLGLTPPVGGELQIGSGVRLGYVPQRSSVDLAAPSRVIDLMRAGCDRGWSFLSPRVRTQAAEEALSRMELGHLRRVQYAELSEGQKQRVLVARALASDPDLLVLDEPTSAMDREAERQFLALLVEQTRSRKLGVLLISHDVDAALAIATHAIAIDRDRDLVLGGTLHDVLTDERCTVRGS